MPNLCRYKKNKGLLNSNLSKIKCPKVTEPSLLTFPWTVTSQFFPNTPIPRAFLKQCCRTGVDICSMRQQKLQVFVKQCHTAGILEGNK